ncbi:hypothetical protein V6N13_051486 [Hibiscus sabdariffa]|uniref:Uncharacterized protein n=1 Tax=Hibiscus sabdariffa TaxID=183260 RepID=A0ABR2T3G2_9ROSI
MLDGIFARGFASKCKSLIKAIKSRIDVIRRKRSATLKFLKKDIADLLANGLDINAYGRVEGYIAELLLSSCYDFIEKCCDVVLKNVSVMQKLSDCPEDCKEAVSSLMFAAARFSDLPELRDLRQIFHGRYENSLDSLVNKQLVENSTSNPSAMEKKVKAMNDIASEFSLKWDSKAFERRMSKPPVVPKDQLKNYGSFHVNGDNNTSNDRKSADPQGGELKVSSKGKLEVATIGLRLNNWKGDNASKRDEMIFLPKSEFPSVEDKPCHAREEAFKIKENADVLSRQKQEISAGKSEFGNGKDDVTLKTMRLSSSSSRKRMERVNGGAKIQDDRENSVRRIENQDVLTQRKPDLNPSNSAASCLKSRDQDLFITDSYADVYSFQNSTRKTHKAGESKRKPHSKSGIPPPYVQMPSIKSKDSRHGAVIGSPVAGSDINGVSSDTSIPDKEVQIIPHMRGRETDYYYSHEGSDTPIPRRRSSRRRHVKSASGHVEIGDDDDDTEVARRKPRSKRRDDSRRGLQILFDDEKHRDDEEERIIDRLLMHYCKKPSSSEDGVLRRKSRSHHVHHMRSDAGEVPQKASRDRSGDISKTIPRPVRSISLPRVQTTQSEGTKVYARATSFQPDRSNASRHVHPKLPDYDDLAAHFAAMKGI